MTSTTGKRGLTLIEVLISVAILAGGVVLIMPALARTSFAMEAAALNRSAYLFSSTKLAEAEVAFREGAKVKERTSGSFRSGPQSFTWVLTADEVAGEARFRSVALEVLWRRGVRSYERRFETVLQMRELEEE